MKTPKVNARKTAAQSPQDAPPMQPSLPVPKAKGRARLRPHSPHLTIEVGREEIEYSVRRDSSHCMIAETIKRKMPTARGVAVDLGTIRWTDPEKRLRYIYLTPRSAQIALIEFDRGILPEPFRFTLRTAAQIIRPANRRKRVADEDRNARTRKNYHDRKGNAANADQPAAKGRRSEIMQAMADPTADLGTATAMTPALGKLGIASNVPVIVGGRPPPLGNLSKIRRFGLRQLRE
jgi:hypothetical protein